MKKNIEELGAELAVIKDKNCENLIKENLASLNNDLKEMMDNPNHDDYFDDPALSVDKYQLTSICLSYGGPSSYLEVKHQGSHIISVTYRYSDWFDTATLPVFDSEPAYDYARRLCTQRNRGALL